MRRLLALSDCFAVAVSFAVAGLIDRGFGDAIAPVALLIPGLAIWVVLAAFTGMYHVDEKRIDCSIADEFGRVIQITAIWTWLLFLIDTLGADGSTSVVPAITLWAVAVPTILLARAATRRIAQRAAWYRQSAFVVGRPGDTDIVCRLLARHPEWGVDVDRQLLLDPGTGLARVESLIDLAEASRVDRVIFASSYEGLDERTGALRFLSEQGVKVDLVPGDSEVFRSDAELHFVEGLPLLTLPTTNPPRSASFLKRLIDITVAVGGLAVLWPVFAYAAVRIKLDSPGPVFFRQLRLGRRGETFCVLKFRTMAVGAEKRQGELASRSLHGDGKFKLVHDPRVTKFGAKLRRTSIDELPQLINILRGEMSLVGPRPLPLAESEMVVDQYQARFSVRPGMTGPWQVLGRSDIPFHDMLKLDYAYVTNWSLGDDMRLLMRTLGAIAHGRGAY